ncbi:ectoine/hydroxyectoine ABC transporter substrate-binding protein EhuB [Mesorhizobium sp. SARCC-RB16n]|uniref:ectoine/hydroxyectoine ABC transporter substrate-binding protein EhuB n=1 Tax=Mesorhizobium sp. SARCC-RB16n TaxID=2116687 RepID=UPI00122F0B4A|nr:ectoine/hydroxyectoine ABC transporter substrate-binding protein EhuB [Mesorhizobium sp. SARCC-RB16n]KAA3448101.1 ectoine/hydroxyectoine ABC transporter substrate-binding protein EhuB [Mesorhizobium sp. SARCC-RB16n]
MIEFSQPTSPAGEPRRTKGSVRLAAMLAAAATSLVLSAQVSSAVTFNEVKTRGYITIAIANEIPASYTDSSGEVKGSEAEVARRVLEQMGIKSENIQWVVTTFSSLIPGLQANRFDMTAAGMAIRPERCQKVIYSEPDSSYGEGLLVAKGNPKNLHSYEDVAKEGTIAVMAGADQLQMMQKLGVAESRIVTIASNADAISAIATGRADAYAAAATTAADLAKKSDKVGLAQPFKDPVVEGKVQRSWGAFSFNKNSTDLRDKFNEALQKFEKTEDFKKILLEYGSTAEDISKIPEKTTEQLCSQ